MRIKKAVQTVMVVVINGANPPTESALQLHVTQMVHLGVGSSVKVRQFFIRKGIAFENILCEHSSNFLYNLV